MEHLRKAAKRLARANGIRLAAAQRALAQSYGIRSWTALVRAAEERAYAADGAPPLLAAVRAGDRERVRALLARGANPRVGDGRDLPLHVAARRGDRALAEELIARGALVWQPDGAGRTALDAARLGRSRERAAVIALLDRSVIADPSFRAAVRAVHAGDAAGLDRLLSARPALLHERNTGPEAYRLTERFDYFRDPKLFWFIANNPTLVARMPDTIVDVAAVMIGHGVEQGDLDYALELVMTSASAREHGHQIPLMRLLLGAGAVAGRRAVIMAAGHRELDAVRELLAGGRAPLDAPVAAALGDCAALAALLRSAARDDVQQAFGLAVINHELEAARLALGAGADVNAPLPVHAHSTALHQAAGDDHADIASVLLEHGARTDARDSLWDATPLDWARYGRRQSTTALLERHGVS